jgi:hypothetical protein
LHGARIHLIRAVLGEGLVIDRGVLRRTRQPPPWARH